MKKYKLKQWYPSLGGDFKNGEKIIFWEERGCYMKNFGDDISLRKTEVENNPDFWELIEEKEPLFITEDGVEIFSGQTCFYIDIEFNKRSLFALDPELAEGVKTFKHESNADEYIWKNKPVFSYKDIQNYGVHPLNMIWVEQLAKERTSNGK